MNNNVQIISFTVPQEYNGAPLKAFLKQSCGVSSRLMIQLKQTENGITNNNLPVRVVDRIHAGDIIKIALPCDTSDIPPVAFPLDIVFEDAHILLINKPADMPVHPTSCGHTHDTLGNAVAAYMKTAGETYAFRPVNRLDKDTTGLVLIAKNPYAAFKLMKNVDKSYLAVCEGTLSGEGTVDAPIKIKDGHVIQRTAGCGGSRAVTHYVTLRQTCGHSLLQLKLETGRTHQIRVHMAYIGHPLAGDDMYGGSLLQIRRQALHCGQMSFMHPVTGERLAFCAPLPEDMMQFAVDYP